MKNSTKTKIIISANVIFLVIMFFVPPLINGLGDYRFQDGKLFYGEEEIKSIHFKQTI